MKKMRLTDLWITSFALRLYNSSIPIRHQPTQQFSICSICKLMIDSQFWHHISWAFKEKKTNSNFSSIMTGWVHPYLVYYYCQKSQSIATACIRDHDRAMNVPHRRSRGRGLRRRRQLTSPPSWAGRPLMSALSAVEPSPASGQSRPLVLSYPGTKLSGE